MSIDPMKDTLLTLKEAARICPRIEGKKPHFTSVWRWVRYGLQGHYLESVRVGGRYCTTESALTDFFRARATVQTRERTGITKTAKPRTDKHREKAVAEARKRLEARGLFKKETRH
jgi:hypothetical protein